MKHTLKEGMLHAVPEMEKPHRPNMFLGTPETQALQHDVYLLNIKKYEAHLKTLPPPVTPSPEFLEHFKGRTEFEDSEFEVNYDSHPDCLEKGCRCERGGGFQCVYSCDHARDLAYPVKGLTEESQEDLWGRVISIADDVGLGYPQKVQGLSKYFTITRKG